MHHVLRFVGRLIGAPIRAAARAARPGGNVDAVLRLAGVDVDRLR